ncbi:MAG: acyl-ACP--UDP-N-acetylglucosamine O-acyltransferase [Terrimicrobiaceae bacterium]|nr:acyl-ACP--UDP-N-acetylglucosamine O-acyltransferase [Terrimicrobiaceae bacterium]
MWIQVVYENPSHRHRQLQGTPRGERRNRPLRHHRGLPTIGDDCTIQAHAILTNRTTLGARNFVGYGAVIGAAPQDFAHDASIRSEVVIGDDNAFREYVTVHRGTKAGSVTRIGSRNLLMVGVHVGHNSTVGDRNVMANNCLLAGYVRVGDDVVLGGGAVFHQFLRVGGMTMIRGGTAWSKDIPPFTVGKILNIVCGINSVGMRRKGLTTEARRDVKLAYNLVYRSGLNVTQAIEQSGSMEWTPEGGEFIDFIKDRSKRGLCSSRGAGMAAVVEDDDVSELGKYG